MARTPGLIVVVGLLAALAAIGAIAIAGGLPGISQQTGPRVVQGTGFTFQGRVTVDGVPVTGACDLRFTLHSEAVAVAQVGAPETISSAAVTNGLFAVTLNIGGAFGASPFTGDARWLQTEARCPAGGGTFVSLGRTQLTSTPYASFAMDSAELGGFPAAEYARYARVVLVQAGGTPAQNGLNLAAKLAGITGASPSNRYLLLLEPGEYEAGIVATGAGIDIAGMQPGTSIIRGEGEDGLVQPASGTTMTNVVVEATTETGIAVRTGAGTYTFREVTLRSRATGIQALDGLAEIFLEDSTIDIFCENAVCTGIDLTSGAHLSASNSVISLTAGAVADTDQTAVNATSSAGDIDITGGAIRVNAGLSAGLSRGVIAGSGSDVSLRGTTLSMSTLDQVNGMVIGGSLALDDIAFEITGESGMGIITFGPTSITESVITTDGVIAVWFSEGASGSIDHSTVTSLSAGLPIYAVLSAVINVRHSVIIAPADVPVASGQLGPVFSFSTLRGAAMTFSTIAPTCRAVIDENNVFSPDTCP